MKAALDQLLSEDELRAIISRFYDRVYRDPVLKGLFENVDRFTQELRLLRFIKMTTLGPADRLDGAFLRSAHARLQLDDSLFERRRTLLEAAIRDCGYGDSVSAAWKDYDERWRPWVLGDAALRAPE